MLEADFVVVGGGITGVCAAYHLAKQGRDVLLVERDEIGPVSPISSSGEHARAFRSIYGADERMTALCTQSLLHWKQFEAESGTELFVPTGMLVFGASGAAALEHWAQPTSARFAVESAEVLSAAGLPHQLMSKAEVIERYPQIASNRFYDHAILDQTAGFIHARKAVHTISALAKRLGTAIWDHTTVHECVRNGAHVECLVTNRGDVRAKRAVIFAAGYMNSVLVPELHGKTRVSEHRIIYFKPPELETYAPGRFPIVVDINAWRYVFPVHGPGLMKVVDDDKYDSRRWVSQLHDMVPLVGEEEFRDDAREFLTNYVPKLVTSEEVGTNVCRYTNTSHGKYLIFRNGNAVVLSACSGHGFKNAPMTALLAASLADSSGLDNNHPSAEFGYQYAHSF